MKIKNSSHLTLYILGIQERDPLISTFKWINVKLIGYLLT